MNPLRLSQFTALPGLLAVLCTALMLTVAVPAPAAQPKAPRALWADFVETNFSFISGVLDARKLGQDGTANNLTPRGLVLNLGHDAWACFDTELLRMAAIWVGKGVTPLSMAQNSYFEEGAKVPDGQSKLPEILGTPWLLNGIYPGWQAGDKYVLADPRESGPDARELGRGPLPASAGRFTAIRLLEGGFALEYEVAGTSIREWVQARDDAGRIWIRRVFRMERVEQPLWLLMGQPAGVDGLEITLPPDGNGRQPLAELQRAPNGLAAILVHASAKPVEFTAAIGYGVPPRNWEKPATTPPRVRWPEKVITHTVFSKSTDAYVVDDIGIPTSNPWRRNVRLGDLAFFRDGRAATVTFDGDVWLIDGLGSTSGEVKWKRFASGLHEPISLAIRNEELFVFDRNGIWRLVDTDGNGEADAHELFSNAFAQTAETREFACSMKVAPDGSFVIGKGGIQTSTLGKHNASVLRISPDGRSVSVLGTGLREPFVGVHPKTGLVTASDQQGNYIPSTPLHIIRDGQFYGFLSSLLPKEKYPGPIAEPLTWIPHPVNASGVTQVWLTDARMGPLNDALIHIGYYRPEVFVVLLNERTPRLQAAVVSLTRNFEFAPLSGAVNPVDGQLYISGFQIWGSAANRISGLARVRYTGLPTTLPREVVPMDKGILVRFSTPLDPAQAVNPVNFSAERWNYIRTANYGSPHLRLDGAPGQEWMTPSSAYLSRDRKAVFIGIPGMKPVMQMRLGWALKLSGGATFEQNAYFTPYELAHFDPSTEGFEPVNVDLTPRASAGPAAGPVSREEGQRVAELMGCAACHSNDGTTLGKVGPTWKGLFGKERVFKDGSKMTANEAYLRESMIEPTAKIVREFEKSDAGMPSYAGVISDSQIESLILYIKSLH